VDRLKADGFGIVPSILDGAQIERLLAELAAPIPGPSLRTRGGLFAIRNLLEAVPAVNRLARSKAVRDVVMPILGPRAIPVQAMLFDKTPSANWLVPWHQDLTIAVRQRMDVDGFGPWSVKGGVPHVQPPAAILEAMLAVRIHLDPCSDANGALRVLPGTHRLGRLPDEQITAFAESVRPVICAAAAGDAVLMRPLLLHASSASDRPEHRRVIHIEFAAGPLPPPLEWRTRRV
jgi:ectoine hydroxylase-related dioxygenase (phytanoyl-CoA dioxygenase family)